MDIIRLDGKGVIGFIVSLILCPLITGCSILQGPRLWRESGPEVPELSAFDTTMKDFMVSREVSAGALAITYDSRLVFAKGYTWARKDEPVICAESLFRIASLSKPITSAAVFRLVEDGELKLDEKVGDVLSLACAADKYPDPNLKDVTVLHLLQHLGGWDRDEAFDPMFQDKRISRALYVPLPISRAHIIKFMNGQPLQRKPGTEYAYSNYGYCLLGRVIEKRSAMTYEGFVRQEILLPLGITEMRLGRSERQDRAPGEVIYEAKQDGAYGGFNLENMDSHGGWLASAPELVRFAAAFDNPCSCPILSSESIATMFAPPVTIHPDEYEPGERYYACGWNVRGYGNGERNAWHTGSLPGTYTFMARWRNGVDCVVLFNKRADGFSDIDPLLSKTAKSVKNWPEHDLFCEKLN